MVAVHSPARPPSHCTWKVPLLSGGDPVRSVRPAGTSASRTWLQQHVSNPSPAGIGRTCARPAAQRRRVRRKSHESGVECRCSGPGRVHHRALTLSGGTAATWPAPERVWATGSMPPRAATDRAMACRARRGAPVPKSSVRWCARVESTRGDGKAANTPPVSRLTPAGPSRTGCGRSRTLRGRVFPRRPAIWPVPAAASPRRATRITPPCPRRASTVAWSARISQAINFEACCRTRPRPGRVPHRGLEATIERLGPRVGQRDMLGLAFEGEHIQRAGEALAGPRRWWRSRCCR